MYREDIRANPAQKKNTEYRQAFMLAIKAPLYRYLGHKTLRGYTDSYAIISGVTVLCHAVSPVSPGTERRLPRRSDPGSANPSTSVTNKHANRILCRYPYLA